MNIAEILHRQVQQRPDAAALIDTRWRRPRTVTFAELDAASARAARLLQRHGVTAGDAALVFQPMSIELYVALLALFRLGAVAMFLDPSAGKAHLEQCCGLVPPKALIASTKAHLLRFVSPALRRIPHKFAIGWPLPGAVAWRHTDREAPYPSMAPCDADTPALLTFTSGSTGRPRAAVRSHGFLRAQHRVLEKNLDLRPGHIDLSTLPVFVLANLASGVTSLLPDADLRRPGSVDPGPILRQIDTHQPSRTAGSPAFYERLVSFCEQEHRTLPFERIDTGGAPVFPVLLDRLHHAAPSAELHAVYGSTEAEPIAHVAWQDITPEDLERTRTGHGLPAGPPVEDIRLRIFPHRWGTPIGPFTQEAFDALCLPVDTPGEIVVSGAHVLGGYLNGEGDQETKFEVDGARWHRTGDEGYLDEQGRLWLLGRSAARLDDARGALYPFGVECAAMDHGGIARAAVLAHEGRRLLIVEPQSGAPVPDPDALKTALAWARLDEIRLLKQIPVDKRHNAKIDYPALRALLKGT